MALFATHIRFAMDLIDNGRYSPGDHGQYLSGTTYPDSRWLSKIDRNLTHVNSIPDNTEVSDDFKLGWLVHCQYDQIQNELQQPLYIRSDNSAFSEWTFNSALKVIQDMNDVKFISNMDLEQTINFINNPFQEDISAIENFFQLVIEVYNLRSVINLSDYTYLWLSVGLSPDRTEDLIEQIKRLLKNEALVKKIHNLYEQTVLAYLEKYPV